MALNRDQINERVARFREHLDRMRADRQMSSRDYQRGLEDLAAWAKVKREEWDREQKSAAGRSSTDGA